MMESVKQNKMKKVAIIGGGIVGATAAYLLSKNSNYVTTLFDSGKGQATKAAAGIISPWLSKRRNQQWYALAKDGAAYIDDLAQETQMTADTYLQSGTIVTRKRSADLDELEQLALKHRQTAPEIGEIQRVSAEEIQSLLPLVTADLEGIFVSGGARIDGNNFVNHLVKLGEKNGLRFVHAEVQLKDEQTVLVNEKLENFDFVLVCAGAGIKRLLSPLNYEVRVHSQKGQLIELKVPAYSNDVSAPVLMPEGEKDFMPVGNGQLIIGATHENNPENTTAFTDSALHELLTSAIRIDSRLSEKNLVANRVGMRAFTDDFAPFFGWLPDSQHIMVASGLGSSGLTTGPLIAKLMVSLIETPNHFSNYQKEISNYIHKKG
ncbi:Glycine/D-amino acid oxidase family [Pediococcus damnosus]|uniref:Glycine/D-amino acid oxidase family n=2 Tax=Pediococcus damnosus TaxID=51663 RepID=A0ABN4NBT9_9LACO|nr:Glycine/D-amino acid oxidase family [Pediococcus damnosus]PIO81872.1 FAD-dependent oxidoreductase [Pediococcus damnosus]PIO84564.1 FAD-dependent oxidoreductase [Pediococcus damnosus]PJE48592.1 FAD-dependent oxidoreductase [Pediococcus damnosus]